MPKKNSLPHAVKDYALPEKALQLINAISLNFINISLDEPDNEINKAMQSIGEFAGADRCYIFLFSDDGATIKDTYEWCRNGIDSQIRKFKGESLSAFPWSVERIRRFETITIHSLSDLPVEARPDRERFQEGGVKSLLAVPMVYGGSLIGILGHESVREEKKWQDEMVSILKIVGGIFAAALVRKEDSEELQKSEEKFRQIFEKSPVGMVLGNMDGGFLEVNPAYYRMIGYSEAELKTMTFFDLTYPEDRDRQRPLWEQCCKGEIDSFRIEKRYIKKSGEIIWVNVHVYMIQDREGMSRYPLAMVEDITERKNIEKALRVSEERGKAQYHGNPIPVYTWQKVDDDFMLIDYNMAADKKTKGMVKKILNIKLSVMYKDRPQIIKEMWKCYNEKVVINREIPYTFSFTNHVMFFNTFYAFSPPDLVLVHTEDITERKRAEQELKRYRQQLEKLVAKRTKTLRLINEFKETIISTIPSAIVVINKKFKIVTVNERLFQLFSVERETDIIGLDFCTVIGCNENPKKCHGMKKACREISGKSQKIAELECVMQVRSREMIVSIHICRMLQENKERFLLVLEDVTKNRMLERQLLLSERLAATGRLAASIAHEINNPLQGMLIHLDIIKENLPEHFKEFESYDFIKDNINKIKFIVSQLFDVYRDSEKSKSLVNINNLIKKVISLINHQISMKGIQLELNLKKELPKIKAWQQQLHQVLLNLLLNASDSIEKNGTITVSTFMENNFFTIRIEDTGKGIDDTILEHIFDPFFSTKGKSGVGLGLFVCQGFIQNHKGNISVQSEVGRGSIFTITLPMDNEKE
ncbi:MAG: PAS domain S-box protein [bacterium]